MSLTIWAPVELRDTPVDETPVWERGTITGTPADLTAALAAYAAVGATAAVLVLGGSPQRRLADLDRIMRDVAPALPVERGS